MNNQLLFYKVMNYPVPIQKEYFFYLEKLENLDIQKIDFSRENKSDLNDNYIKFLNKWGMIYRSIPFINSIYLSGNISFNTIIEKSPIQILIISKRNRIWLCKLFSDITFGIFNIFSKIKFKTEFFVAEDGINLYNFAQKPIDVYFIYWLAHLVPLYNEDLEFENRIYKENRWMREFLPNFNLENNIKLDTDYFMGKNGIKTIFEKIIGNQLIGGILESIIRCIWMPIILLKTKKCQATRSSSGTFINNKIIKTNKDLREKYNLMFKISYKSDK